MPSASPPLTLVVAACVVGGVVLPIAFIWRPGPVVGLLRGVGERGRASPAQGGLLRALGALGLLFVLQQILVMLRGATADALGRRVLGSHARRVMRAVMAPA